jgi:RNA polymerase sigma-70 factor (ECF subfamily)
MSDPLSSADCIAAARAGDRDAGDRLFARAADRLLLFVRLRLGQGLRARVDSLDVLQETFLHAHRDLASWDPGRGDPERAFVQWLCAIAGNRLRDLAAWHGAKRRDHRADERHVSAVLASLQRSGHGPATSLVRREERDRLAEAAEQLGDEDREVFVLRHFAGHPIEAIADQLGRSASSVRRSLGRSTREVGRRLLATGGDKSPSEVTS